MTTPFTEAAAVFGPQKGASPAQVELLTRRLERMVQMFAEDFGVDVSSIPGGGAAGGLGGALAALGGRLLPGFDLVADEARSLRPPRGRRPRDHRRGPTRRHVASTARSSVGSLSIAADAGVPVLAIVGSVDPAIRPSDGLDVLSLTEIVGEDDGIRPSRSAAWNASSRDWLATRALTTPISRWRRFSPSSCRVVVSVVVPPPDTCGGVTVAGCAAGIDSSAIVLSA